MIQAELRGLNSLRFFIAALKLPTFIAYLGNVKLKALAQEVREGSRMFSKQLVFAVVVLVLILLDKS